MQNILLMCEYKDFLMTSKSFIKPSIRVLVGDALDSIPKLDGIFDMVFIDADKSEYLDYLRAL